MDTEKKCNEPDFSIIVPLFNDELYIKECLYSILNQEIKNIEVIVVNDGSTDLSKEIVLKIANSDPRVKLIDKKNEGLLLARRDGIQYANGKYFLFIDSDDLFEKDALKSIAEIINHNKNFEIIIFELQRFFPNGQTKTTDNSLEEGKVDKTPRFYKILFGTYKLNNLVCKCVKKEIIKSIDYKSLPKVFHGEDLIQSASILTIANTIYSLKKPLYKYRLRGNNRSIKFNSNILEDAFNNYRHLKHLISRLDIDDTSITRRLNLKYLIFFHKTLVAILRDECQSTKEKKKAKQIYLKYMTSHFSKFIGIFIVQVVEITLLIINQIKR